MWFQFLIGVLVTLLLFYMPGSLLLRTLQISRFNAILLAPAVSVVAYVIVSIVISAFHFFGSWITIVVPVALFSLAVYGSSFIRPRVVAASTDVLLNKTDRKTVGIAVAYVLVASAISTIFFLKNLDGAGSYMQLYDSAWHMGIIRNFLENGDYSPLHSGNIIPTEGSTFYPTGYHTIVALLCSFTGISLPVASNAVIFVEIAVLLPTSVYVLFSVLFAHNTKLLRIGMIVPVMFQTFPWLFITFGPLWSNLLATCVAPAILAVLVVLFRGQTCMKERICATVYSLFAFLFAAFTQPNTIFTLAVLIAPYVFTQIQTYCFGISDSKKHRACLVSSYIGLCILIMGSWAFLYKSSFMQRTVTWNWEKIGGIWQVVRDVYMLGFSAAEGQPVLAVLVLLGIAVTILKREYLWITISYLIFCLFYIISAGTEGRLKHIMTGFWYTDYHRLASSAILVALPLAALGLTSVLRFVVSSYEVMCTNAIARDKKIVSILLTIAVASCIFVPYVPRDMAKQSYNAFGAVTRDIHYWNAGDEPKTYSKRESEFVQKVKKEIPQDSVVINNPYDGSAYAWGQDSLNVLYKAWQGNWMGTPTEDSTIIMTRLNELTQNASVCTAVRNINARYLIILDKDDYREVKSQPEKLQSIYASYNKTEWAGIDSITKTTPGFTLLMEHKGMQLYKIDSCS